MISAAKGQEVLSREFVRKWAAQYDAKVGVKDKEEELKAWLRARFREGRAYLDKGHFVEIATWKSQRPLRHYESNDDDLVQEVTALAFAVPREHLRLRVLTLLNGVGVPVASTILHFAFPGRYAIMDVRAVTTLTYLDLWTRPGPVQPGFTGLSVADWQVYTHLMRQHARPLGVTLRELDKALWAFDKHGGADGAKAPSLLEADEATDGATD
jgi:hypothetical protein